MYDLKYFILSLRCLSGKLGVNKKISGTFNFTCADENNSANTKAVTEGTFTDVPKQ